MAQVPIFEKKNVVVTGGAGFIGSHLCEELLKQNKVICIDNLSNAPLSNIEHLLKDPNFEFLKIDVNQPFDLENFPELEKFKVKFQGVQEVYHLACPTSGKNFEQYKMQTLLANSFSMKYTLDLAVKNKAKYLFASSAVVYGPRKSDGTSMTEDYAGVVNHLSQRGCYDEGKRFAETMAETYRQIYGLEVKIARIFRTYGPRLKLYDGQMISDFIVNALNGEDLVIYGDETFSTPLLYVSDLVDGLTKLMASEPELQVVNFGSDRVYRVYDMAEQIIKMTNSKSRIVFNPPLLFITPLGVPDISRAKNELGWFPLVSLEQGLEKTISYTVAQQKKVTLR